jgi:hypothetical protein
MIRTCKQEVFKGNLSVFNVYELIIGLHTGTNNVALIMESFCRRIGSVRSKHFLIRPYSIPKYC